jgi:peptidoglycan/xylan/chitin deacetylase (PgdA/CDA1 family)
VSALEALRKEVAQSVEEGRDVALWWRDDDLIAHGANFEALIGLSARTAIPLLIAIIPGLVDQSLDIHATDPALAFFCQHGWQHRNHEPGLGPKSEFGPGRAIAEVRDEVIAGRGMLERLLGNRLLPAFVPPWNAFDPRHGEVLDECGFTGLSTYTIRTSTDFRPGIRMVNTHLDVLRWDAEGGPVPLALDDLLARLADLVMQHRLAGAAELEPIGLLTHHRAMRPDTWPAVEALFAALCEVDGITWRSPGDLFASGSA